MMGFLFMGNEIFDDIEWEISTFWSIISSGDEEDEWIYEFDAKGVDDNGNELTGTAYYTGDGEGRGLIFDYIEYEFPEEDEEDEEE